VALLLVLPLLQQLLQQWNQKQRALQEQSSSKGGIMNEA
jgi:hypothetical protein